MEVLKADEFLDNMVRRIAWNEQEQAKICLQCREQQRNYTKDASGNIVCQCPRCEKMACGRGV